MMIRVVAHAIEDRLTHVIGGAVEHQRVGTLLVKQIVDGGGKSRCEHFVAAVTQRK